MSTPPQQEDATMGQALCEQAASLIREMNELRQRIQCLPQSERAQFAAMQFDIDLKQLDLELSLMDVQ